MADAEKHIGRRIAEAQHGASMDDLFRLHAGWLRTFLLRRLRAQPADVEDIVQDTDARAARQPATAIVHPKAFLSRTATNIFRDAKCRESVRVRHRNSVAPAGEGAEPVPPGLLEQEAALELERLIMAMPDGYRDVFALSRFRHMTNAEIAAHLDISVKTVEWRMGKALAFCASRLRD
ncbi:RNA polymerase sigma factor [Sphingomonas sp. NFR15]|uniref:RNA polymerase sigma factor n=1 Tax=Sphingomonas sp. NFR15 TaxID=1566282 RepID=UPI00088E86F8|nr:sigma factor-like helix-turn-helix DNA-binding protein [Sphingomonas sp. NFR15]SDA36915.1 RNA polymerase sigma-70 factor, ECF subfamily [Sphingomonas sp. NFR15]